MGVIEIFGRLVKQIWRYGDIILMIETVNERDFKRERFFTKTKRERLDP